MHHKVRNNLILKTFDVILEYKKEEKLKFVGVKMGWNTSIIL